jgi:hypothetical protein
VLLTTVSAAVPALVKHLKRFRMRNPVDVDDISADMQVRRTPLACRIVPCCVCLSTMLRLLELEWLVHVVVVV